MPAVRPIPSVYLNYDANGALFLASAVAGQNVTVRANGTGAFVLGATGANPACLFNGFAYSSGELFLKANASSSASSAGALVVSPNGGVNVGGISAAPPANGLVVASSSLFGTTVNSGALVNVGTNTTTITGGQVFGTDTFWHRGATAQMRLSGAGDARICVRSTNSGSAGIFFVPNNNADANGCTIRATATASPSLEFYSNEVLGQTLDSSQNTILAGSLATVAPTGGAGVWKLGKYTAGALAPAGYVTVNIDGTDRRLLIG